MGNGSGVVHAMRAPESYYLPEGTEIISSTGQTGLWIAFVCMAAPALFFWYKAQSKPSGKRKFEYLSFTINAIASLAYLTMAVGYGATEVNGQQFFFARYVDWSLTTPLMLLDLILLAHGEATEFETVAHILAIDMFMIVGGLIGAMQGGHNSSWMFFAFSMFFFCPIFYYLLYEPEFQSKIKVSYSKVYKNAAWLTFFFWCGYPVVWVLHEGTQSISLDAAVIVYLILDTMSKSVWGILITMGRDAVDQNSEARAVTSSP